MFFLGIVWAATLSNCTPLAVYRLSKCALHGGNPSWRTLLYELPVQKGFIFGENPCRIETMRNCNVIIFMLKSSRLQDIQWHGKIRKAWRLLFQDAWHKERSISALSYGYRKTAAVEQFPQKNLTCSIAQTAAFFRCSVRLLANVCMLRDGLFVRIRAYRRT